MDDDFGFPLRASDSVVVLAHLNGCLQSPPSFFLDTDGLNSLMVRDDVCMYAGRLGFRKDCIQDVGFCVDVDTYYIYICLRMYGYNPKDRVSGGSSMHRLGIENAMPPGPWA